VNDLFLTAVFRLALAIAGGILGAFLYLRIHETNHLTKQAVRQDLRKIVVGIGSFRECPECLSKTGCPTLCPSCQHNRAVIEAYEFYAELGSVPRWVGTEKSSEAPIAAQDASSKP